MRLLRLGRRYVNFDQVCHTEEDETGGVCVFFTGENGARLQLAGEEAAKLKQWLRLNGAEAQTPPKSHRHTWPTRARTDGRDADG